MRLAKKGSRGVTEEAIFLIAQAERCRRLARTIDDDRATDALLKMAIEYEARAEFLSKQTPAQS